MALWLHEFARAHPQLSIELLLDDRYVDLRAAGVDVAVRIGRLADSALTARRLGTMALALVAAPELAGALSGAREPADLAGQPFVLYSLLQSGEQMLFTHRSGRQQKLRMGSRFAANNVAAIRRVVLAGGGLHAGPLWLFDDDLRAGRLVRVLPAWRPPDYEVHAVHGYGRQAPAKVLRFLDVLAQRIGSVHGIARFPRTAHRAK